MYFMDFKVYFYYNCLKLRKHMREEYFKWYSPNLSRDIEMLVFGHAGYPVILFPTSMGSFYENRDQGLIGSAHWFIEQGLVQIFCPDSVDKDSFYNKKIHPVHRIRNHMWYDKNDLP